MKNGNTHTTPTQVDSGNHYSRNLGEKNLWIQKTHYSVQLEWALKQTDSEICTDTASRITESNGSYTLSSGAPSRESQLSSLYTFTKGKYDMTTLSATDPKRLNVEKFRVALQEKGFK